MVSPISLWIQTPMFEDPGMDIFASMFTMMVWFSQVRWFSLTLCLCMLFFVLSQSSLRVLFWDLSLLLSCLFRCRFISHKCVSSYSHVSMLPIMHVNHVLLIILMMIRTIIRLMLIWMLHLISPVEVNIILPFFIPTFHYFPYFLYVLILVIHFCFPQLWLVIVLATILLIMGWTRALPNIPSKFIILVLLILCILLLPVGVDTSLDILITLIFILNPPPRKSVIIDLSLLLPMYVMLHSSIIPLIFWLYLLSLSLNGFSSQDWCTSYLLAWSWSTI